MLRQLERNRASCGRKWLVWGRASSTLWRWLTALSPTGRTSRHTREKIFPLNQPHSLKPSTTSYRCKKPTAQPAFPPVIVIRESCLWETIEFHCVAMFFRYMGTFASCAMYLQPSKLQASILAWLNIHVQVAYILLSFTHFAHNKKGAIFTWFTRQVTQMQKQRTNNEKVVITKGVSQLNETPKV